jgi:hypothetical protein
MGFLLILGIALACALVITGCMHFSGGTWMMKEAPLPEGWPELTAIGEVQVKQYPVYRAATVEDVRVSGGMDPMFMTLFRHIKANDIAMTTPVEMGYERHGSDTSGMVSMAFIYRQSDWGALGADGDVEVRDVASQRMASIGVRGGYTDKRMGENLVRLDAWLAERAVQYRVIGPPRYLGYNGPFTPVFMRYGEVQVPVEAIDDGGSPDPDPDR